MSARVTAILLAIFIVLCGAYWWAITRENQKQVREFAAKKVFAIAPADLRSITVKRADEAPTVGIRDSAEAPWKISQPYPVEAFQRAWMRLTDALANLSDERDVDRAPKDLAQYQLDKPQVTVTAVTASGKTLTVDLGAADPTQTRVYARTPEQGVFLVPKEAVTDLNRPLQDLRNRFMITVGEQGITHLEFALFARKDSTPPGYKPGDESVAVVLDREADGTWKLTKPLVGFANKQLVDKLAGEVQHLTGRNYVDAPENLSDYGLNPPVARITVRSGPTGEPQTIYLGALYKGDTPGGLYAKTAAAPAVFVIDSGIIERFPKTPDGFRDKRLFTRLDGDIQSLHYVSGASDFTLENDPTQGWRIAQPPVAGSDQVVISSFIGLLKVMTCSSFAGPAKPEFGLDHPAIELTLGIKGKDPLQIRVGTKMPGADVYYAMQDTGEVVAINQADMNALTRQMADFRPKQFLRFDKAAATTMKLRFEGTDYTFEKNAGTGSWAITAPAKKVWETQSDMTSLLDAVADAHMEFVETETTPADLSVYGLNDPLVAITVTTQSGPNGATLGPLCIGKTADNNSQQRFAIVQGRTEVFRVGQAFVDTLRDILRGIRDQ